MYKRLLVGLVLVGIVVTMWGCGGTDAKQASIDYGSKFVGLVAGGKADDASGLLSANSKTANVLEELKKFASVFKDIGGFSAPTMVNWETRKENDNTVLFKVDYKMDHPKGPLYARVFIENTTGKYGVFGYTFFTEENYQVLRAEEQKKTEKK